MVKLALIGKNIQHSKSQKMYEKILNSQVDYTLLDFVHSDVIPPASELLKDYDGISITSPYKEHFLSQLNINLSPVLGINTLMLKDNLIVGQNTDYLAAEEILKRYLKKEFHEIILLGDGVMAKLFMNLFKKLELNFKNYSRKLNNLPRQGTFNSELNYFVINTCAREYVYSGSVSKNIFFWDMNYNLDHHRQLFANAEALYIDGIELLELQAKYALSFWNLKDR